MAESAFGVDHGEISKASIPAASMNGLRQIGSKLGQATSGLGTKMSMKGTPPGAGTLTKVRQNMAGGLKLAGQNMSAKPALTGGAALGAGAAAGASAMKPNKPRMS